MTPLQKLDALILEAYRIDPKGSYAFEVPTLEWEEMEAQLEHRTNACRKFMPRVFKWQGEYIVRGGKWLVYKVGNDGEMIDMMLPPPFGNYIHDSLDEKVNK